MDFSRSSWTRSDSNRRSLVASQALFPIELQAHRRDGGNRTPTLRIPNPVRFRYATSRHISFEWATGVEPASSPWHGDVLRRCTTPTSRKLPSREESFVKRNDENYSLAGPPICAHVGAATVSIKTCASSARSRPSRNRNTLAHIVRLIASSLIGKCINSTRGYGHTIVIFRDGVSLVAT